MADTAWTWAELDQQTVSLVEEAERTLGADYVLAYRRGDGRRDVPAAVELRPAPLDASQLECLQGLESNIGVVAVAYRR